MPVAITAKASIPGRRKSTAFPVVAGMMFNEAKKISRSTGTKSVIRTLSPRLSVKSNSTLVWAIICRLSGAA
jgi:hypothetical protein